MLRLPYKPSLLLHMDTPGSRLCCMCSCSVFLTRSLIGLFLKTFLLTVMGYETYTSAILHKHISYNLLQVQSSSLCMWSTHNHIAIYDLGHQVVSPQEGSPTQLGGGHRHYMFNLDEHRYRDIIYAKAAWYIRLWLTIIALCDRFLGTTLYQKAFVAHILGKTQLYEYLVYGMEEWRDSIYAGIISLHLIIFIDYYIYINNNNNN